MKLRQLLSAQDLNNLRKAISKKADKETVEADLDRIHKALRCKANVHAMSEALSQKLDIHSFLTANVSATAPADRIPAYDPSEARGHVSAVKESKALLESKESKAPLSSRPSLVRQSLKHAASARP